MVPVEVTAFGLLAVCVILLAIVQAVQLGPRLSSFVAQTAILLVLLVVVIVAIYAWATTRMR